MLLALIGCERPSLDTTYGRRRGELGAASVNGTAVLAKMFERAGFRVRSATQLSSLMDSTDVIVWFPDDHAVPSSATVEFLEGWLAAESGRTLVYVGRDYDASITYWTSMLESAEPGARLEIRRRLARAKSAHYQARNQGSANGATSRCPWFSLGGSEVARTPNELRGAWSAGVDVAQLQIELSRPLTFPVSSESLTNEVVHLAEITTSSLLSTEDHPVLVQLQRPGWRSSRLLVAQNGSWLLNLPLVQPEHRKLAGRIISECEPGGKAIFLESGPGGPPVARETIAMHPAWNAFTVSPLNVILLHVTVLGILFCFAVFPIFGHRKRLPEPSRTDFGTHIDALGELYAQSHDAAYARDRLVDYRDKVRDKVRGEMPRPSNAAREPG